MGKLTAAVIMVFFCAGCAGPMTPFGSIGWGLHGASNQGKDSLSGQTRLRFAPDRQVLHTSTDFSIIIEDPEGVPDNFRLLISYNDIDVTREFLAHAAWTNMDPLKHEVKLTTKYLRLLPDRQNQVKVSYWRRADSDTAAVVAQYMPPSCSAFALDQTLSKIPEFDPPPALLQAINLQAGRKKMNPFFVAALVAQESGFNPHALSRNKALGLTQVTAAADGELIKHYDNWPRYPGLEDMSLPILKLAILDGEIHAGNEWRLDPTLSIAGGVEYLSYLSEYWHRPEKRMQIETRLGKSDYTVSELMLASYNSGAARVSDSVDRKGTDWLQDDALNEAKKYVHRVVSYCDYFEHKED